jgi:hypothetical protein
MKREVVGAAGVDPPVRAESAMERSISPKELRFYILYRDDPSAAA